MCENSPGSVMKSRRFMGFVLRPSNYILAHRWMRTVLLHRSGVGRSTSDSGQTLPSRRFLRHGCFTPETGHWLARLAQQKSAKADSCAAAKSFAIRSLRRRARAAYRNIPLLETASSDEGE